MKKIATSLLATSLLLAGCSSSKKPVEGLDCDTLKVFSASEYIGENVLSDFEKEYGVKVIYDTFSSNEEMYTKLQGGDIYDVLVPSDYMIERLILEDKLQKIDYSLLENYQDAVMEELLNKPSDPENEYSIPYLWGTVGIVYDKTKVDVKDLEEEGWNIFLDPKYKGQTYFYDSERDAFMVALKALGYSMNSDNEAEIEAANKWLQQMNDTMDPVYATDDIIDNMVSGLKALAFVYSGDAVYITSENENMAFINPKQGTNIWIDSLVITKESKCKVLAHKYIDYMYDYDVAYANTEYVGYTTSHKDVFADISADEENGFGGNDAYIPRSDYDLDEMFRHNDILRKKIADLWIRIKAR